MKKATRKTTRRRLLLPDQFHMGPVTVVAPMPEAVGGVLKGCYTYVVETWRHEGKWQIHVQWIEQRGADLVPMVVDLPHAVCERIAAHREAILRQSRKAGARKAHETAVTNANRQEEGP